MSRKNEILTGAFVLAALGLIVAGALWLSDSRFGDDERRVTADFTQVGQIKPGNTVTVHGVPVGRIEDIVLGEGRGVHVVLRIRSDVELPAAPVVVLQPVSLFGEWQAAIVPLDQRPEIDADTLDLRSGHLPGVTQADFAAMSEYTQEIASNLRGITERFELAFDENTARDISRAVTNFGRASDELVALLERQREGFGQFTSDLADAGEAVRRAAAAVDSTVSRLADATAEGELEAIFAHARDAASSIDSLTGNLRGTARELEHTLARADSAIASAHRLLASIDRGEGTLGRLASDEVLYENTAAALGELRALLDDLKDNPRKYFNFSIF